MNFATDISVYEFPFACNWEPFDFIYPADCETVWNQAQSGVNETTRALQALDDVPVSPLFGT